MNHAQLTSKVLIHEVDDVAKDTLKAFFAASNLTGLKDSLGNVLEIFNRNTDLGAAFLCESPDAKGVNGLELGQKLNKMRPEVPIFLRINDLNKPIPDHFRQHFAGIYHLDALEYLNGLIQKHLFCIYYPIQLVRGIQEISVESFKIAMTNIDVDVEPPYLVKDQIIHGELFSLIPLESNWCRGSMMLQTTEQEICKLIESGKTGLRVSEPAFRDVNQIVSEVTNMIWGFIKSKFFIDDQSENESMLKNRVHVPILVNHTHRFISFGSTEPHLCFRYTIKDNDKVSPDFSIYQKLIFNLNWQPDLFKESQQATDDMVSSGELEFF